MIPAAAPAPDPDAPGDSHAPRQPPYGEGVSRLGEAIPLLRARRRPRPALGEHEITLFLSNRAAASEVSASTQNQAFSALLFLYRDVLGSEAAPVWTRRSRQAAAAPAVVLTRRKCAPPPELTGTPGLMASPPVRRGPAPSRVRDACASRTSTSRASEITVRDGKGRKDRVTVLPARSAIPLRAHLDRIRAPARAATSPRRGQRRPARCPRAEVPGRGASGRGSGSSRRRAHYVADRSGALAGITCTRPSSNGPSTSASAAPASRRRRPATPCGTRSPRICWRRLRHPDHPGAARPQGCRDDDDLHARPQSRWAGGAESARFPWVTGRTPPGAVGSRTHALSS